MSITQIQLPVAPKRIAASVKFQALRSPSYYGRLARFAPTGAWVVINGYMRWVSDTDGRSAVRSTKAFRGTEEGDGTFVSTRVDHRGEMKRNAVISLLGLGAVAAAGLDAWIHTTNLAHWATLGAMAGSMPLGLGLIGKPEGEPIVTPAVLPVELRKLTHDEITAALVSMKIDPELARVGAVVAHKDGWRCEIDLPRGTRASSLVRRREDLAAALERPEGTVWPEVGAMANRLILRVSFKEMSKAEQQEWPLLNAERHNFFERFPLAQNELGGTVDMSLAGTNVVVAAMPEGGKTVTIRLALAAAALDPRTELWIAEHKGTADYQQFKAISSTYITGKRTEQLRESVAMLKAGVREMDERGDRIAALELPEAKVTDAVANHAGLHPLLVIIDECQTLFRSEFSQEAIELATLIAEHGRALGITLVLATQTPDRDSLPRSIMKKVRTRWCGEMDGHEGTDAVLGTAAWADGARPQFGLPGMGILKGQSTHLQTGRTFYVQGDDIDRIVERALALRGGEVRRSVLEALVPKVEPKDDLAEAHNHSLLLDVRDATIAAGRNQWVSELAKRFQMEPETLKREMKNLGISTYQANRRVDGGMEHEPGYKLADIEKALQTKETQCEK